MVLSAVIKYMCYEHLKVINGGNSQRAKKVVSDSPGLVDCAIGPVIFVLNLPDGQLLFWGEIQINDRRIVINPATQKGFWDYLK